MYFLPSSSFNGTAAQIRALASFTGFLMIITMWVISETIDRILIILIQPAETSSNTTRDSSCEAGETRVRNGRRIQPAKHLCIL
jgi:hypothetical protein